MAYDQIYLKIGVLYDDRRVQGLWFSRNEKGNGSASGSY